MRRHVSLLSLLLSGLLAGVLAGCGGKFELPTEHPAAKTIPTNGDYSFQGEWPGIADIQHITVTSGPNTAAFVLLVTNHPASTGPTVPRGTVRCFAVATRQAEIHPGALFQAVQHLFNPIAMSVSQNRMYVLDAGDSCMAKFDAVRNACDADPTAITVTTRPRADIVRDYSATWRVRVYPQTGGDTLGTVSSFTDTTLAQVYGIAADEQGRVYVSGVAAVVDTNSADTHQRERIFRARVYRYTADPINTTGVPVDHRMPGSSWHRDESWALYDGTGNASASDPRGISYWTGDGSNPPLLLVADRGNNKAKAVSVNAVGVGFAQFDGRETGTIFNHPEGSAVDLPGYLYVVDRGNQRVVRYDGQGNFTQIVNFDNGAVYPMTDPVTVGVNDTLAFVGDRATSKIVVFKRRP